jgi:hypothetical protein
MRKESKLRDDRDVRDCTLCRFMFLKSVANGGGEAKETKNMIYT